MRFFLPVLIGLCCATSAASAANPAPFDLTGPALQVRVSHQGATLPIAEVPQLAAGDGIAVRADLPKDQSAHYLLVAAFLRGSTNPPPDKWFTEVETWTKKGRKGLTLTVPEGAEQVVLFLAPETGGDYSTLRNAVKGTPGAFVRAAQDLAQASLDHSRLATYLAAIRKSDPADPDRLGRITPLLARSLQVKINQDCLTKLPNLQVACLLQDQESLVLNDGHSDAITDALQGSGTDLALQLSYTQQGGLGYYSPYIAAIHDIIGIFSSFRTAQYQYIPALATLDGDQMGLLLNAPPSFHNPKSVLVAALPIIAPVHVPPLQLADADPALCAQAPELLVPITGAPLIYATRYAHDLALRVALPDGRTEDWPATPDAERGGLVVHPSGPVPAGAGVSIKATLHGIWGFQPFEGPVVHLQTVRPGQWHVGATAGDTLSLTGGAAACVTGVSITPDPGAARPALWKASGADGLTVTLPAGTRPAGAAVTILGPGGVASDRLTLASPPDAPRFVASVIARNVDHPSVAGSLPLTLAQDSQIPSDATFTFSLRAGAGSGADKAMHFTGQETIEIATASGSASAVLHFGTGLTLIDPQLAQAAIKPASLLGPSAFGPLQARVVRDGVAGDWLPLGTLVRLPLLHGLDCPADVNAPCTLSGERLFLIHALSATPGFEHPVEVPDGYAGNRLQVPHPANGPLYLQLHDDPGLPARVDASVSGAPAAVSAPAASAGQPGQQPQRQ